MNPCFALVLLFAVISCVGESPPADGGYVPLEIPGDISTFDEESPEVFGTIDGISEQDVSEPEVLTEQDTVEPTQDTHSPPDDSTDENPSIPQGPVLYPSERILSPITPFVRQQLLAIAAIDWELEADVFMKVGASSTVSSMNLQCFSGNYVDLGEYENLAPTIAFFNGGNAAGETSFERDSLAAKVGKTAKWALTGDPSPLETEIAAISPLFALVHYGANDMQMGTTYQTAIWSFGDHLLSLTDQLIDQGIIPVLSTISPRLDLDDAYLWVPTYCAVIRGAAQGRQVPLMDVHYAVQDLPGYGLSGDGLHPSTYKENGAARPCNFTEAGLEHGYNMRNLTQCQALRALKESVLDGWEAQESAPILEGDGSAESPFVISDLPFTDLRSTTDSNHSEMDVYFGCDAAQDESGPEYLYRLELDVPTSLRALVFDRGEVDIDLHLLDYTASEEGCIERNHKLIERTLSPGQYHFSLDTFVNNSGIPLSGEYLFVLLACEEGDPDCAP